METPAQEPSESDTDSPAGPGTVLQSPTTLTPAQLAERFAGYARAARGTAMQAKAKGDPYGEQLANKRAETYDQAANLVLRMPPEAAAAEMMNSAGRMHVRKAPLMDFDSAGLQYISARAWQYCALEIDPTLTEQAPPWE